MSEKRKIIDTCLKKYLENEYDLMKDISEDENFVHSLGIDSLGVLKLAISVEEELGIVVPDEELADIENLTYGEVLTFFENK